MYTTTTTTPLLLTTLLSTLALSLPTTSSPSTNFTLTPPTNTTVNTQHDNLTLINSLLLAPKAVDRIALIPNDADFIFDFGSPPASTLTSGLGGHTVRADRQSFPPLIGTGVSMTLGFLGPCGFNTPHVHPRSSEFNVVVEGELMAEFTLENGARTVQNGLGRLQGTVFPMGALHTEWNPGCGNAVFVAGFADEDPGVQQEAQTFFGFDAEAVEAAVGNGFTFEGGDVDKFRKAIPANVALGVESCLKKCNIPKNK